MKLPEIPQPPDPKLTVAYQKVAVCKDGPHSMIINCEFCGCFHIIDISNYCDKFKAWVKREEKRLAKQK